MFYLEITSNLQENCKKNIKNFPIPYIPNSHFFFNYPKSQFFTFDHIWFIIFFLFLYTLTDTLKNVLILRKLLYSYVYTTVFYIQNIHSM